MLAASSAHARREGVPSSTVKPPDVGLILRAKIADLNLEIARLEAENGQKVQRVLQLRVDLSARRTEIERVHRQSQVVGLFAALMGRPALLAVGLADLMNGDGRLRQISSQLGAIEAERTLLQHRISEEAARRAALERDLSRLPASEARLADEVAALAAEAAIPPRSVGEARDRLERSQALVRALHAELAVLRTIRGRAADLAGVLDAAIARLEAEAAQAERLAEDATRAALEVVRLALAAEPEAAAQRWLDQTLAEKTQRLLAQLGLNPADHVKRLAARLIPDSTPEAPRVRQRFVALILAGSPS